MGLIGINEGALVKIATPTSRSPGRQSPGELLLQLLALHCYVGLLDEGKQRKFGSGSDGVVLAQTHLDQQSNLKKISRWPNSPVQAT